MTELLEWLLDLEGIRLGRDAPLFVRFQSEIPAWLLFGGALIMATAIFLVYRREHARPGVRIALGLVRGCLVALVALVLCRPALILQRNRSEPSQVVLLLDQSRSMAAADRYKDDDLAAGIAAGAGIEVDALGQSSRLDLVKSALVRGEGAPLEKLLSNNELRIASFANGVEERGFAGQEDMLADAVSAVDSVEAVGLGTDLSLALMSVIEESKGRRLAAVVLASDGQSTAGEGLEAAVDAARGRRVPVYSIRIGSPVRPFDVEVGPARVEPRVFVNDLVAVEVDVSVTGISAERAVVVRLTDEVTGELLTSREVVFSPGSSSQTVELRAKPERIGRHVFRADVVTIDDETSDANNSVAVEMVVLDDQLDVLYVEGYPRYEYRYLKNALLREKTISISALLLEADSRFVQEGVDPIRTFPETPEQLGRFDVVVFGDVDPRSGWITEAQMRMLLDYVGNEGGGFAMIAGERSAPHRFLGTPLERLLPVKIDPGFMGSFSDAMEQGFRLRPTDSGISSRLFRFMESESRSDDSGPVAGESVFERLPELYWYARTLGPKPGATVLAEHPHDRSPDGPVPLLVSGRYGAGRTFFQATDDSWRWRRHTGELFHDAYWVQAARELMRGKHGQGGRRVAFQVDRRVYRYGEPVRAEVEFLDERLLSLQSDTLEVDVVSDAAGRGTDAMGVALDRFELRRLGPTASVFEGACIPKSPGRYMLRVSGLTQGRPPRPLSLALTVREPDLEGVRPEADHEVLSYLAEATGGSMIELDMLDETLATIPDRSVLIPDDVVEPLWDSKLSLAFFALLIGSEWILRKVFGLL